MAQRPPVNRGMIAHVAKEMATGRALPSSKGGETPNQLQTYRTEVYSYFTQPSSETQLLYSAENWVQVTLSLQTAGPVAIGTVASLAPVLSGRGILLDPDNPWVATLAKGTRLYITSETLNRVNVLIEPIAWLEQIDADSVASQNGVRDAVAEWGSKVVAAVLGLRSGAPESPSGMTAARMPTPRPVQGMLPRLTRPRK